MRYEQLIDPSTKFKIVNVCIRCGHRWRSKVASYLYCAGCRTKDIDTINEFNRQSSAAARKRYEE